MSLIEFCSTERQRQAIKLIEEGKGINETGRILGVHHSGVSKIYTLIKQRAAVQGYAPDSEALSY